MVTLYLASTVNHATMDETRKVIDSFDVCLEIGCIKMQRDERLWIRRDE